MHPNVVGHTVAVWDSGTGKADKFIQFYYELEKYIATNINFWATTPYFQVDTHIISMKRT